MSRGRHSYVRFFPSDWMAGTARMTRLHRSVYFDICCYNWDKGEPVPPAELALMLMDIEGGATIVSQLINAGKLEQTREGVFCPRAMDEAAWAMRQWRARSKGGRAYRPSANPVENIGESKSVPSLMVSNNQNHNHNQNTLPFGELTPKKEPSVPKKGGDRASRLATDWTLPEDWSQWAWREMGWQRAEIEEEAAKFADYWWGAPGARGRKVDWLATWRNWCRNSKRPKPKQASRNDDWARQL